jgi:hypothetical protein
MSAMVRGGATKVACTGAASFAAGVLSLFGAGGAATVPACFCSSRSTHA